MHQAFSPAVIACLPPEDFTVTPQNSRGRVDLRHLAVCSIDPPGCRDIDDALHARMLPSGLLEVGVHIADVSYYVRPGTAIDAEAQRRATTTYIVERRLDMLPKLLTETLCSVKGNVDRFVFSTVWEIDPETYETRATRFHRSIVHSRAAMTYGDAQAYSVFSFLSLFLEIRGVRGARGLRQAAADPEWAGWGYGTAAVS